ncbi:uncharacterized protein LOC112203874 [Rosa chinensis]|uniref:uncharacterized protein LOC112203874 n=1 Tax=Rosa chinensis TaxID=74649 RepID=UPI000D0940D8|nr:uncharacterized protein LOC112203874 [Rosa chinensis]
MELSIASHKGKKESIVDQRKDKVFGSKIDKGPKKSSKESIAVNIAPVTSGDDDMKYMAKVPSASAVYSLMYCMDKASQCVVGYVDSDFAGDLDKCRYTTAYVFTLASGPVSWKSNLQSKIALSTTEAEYMVVTEGAKEAVWLREFEIPYGDVRVAIGF